MLKGFRVVLLEVIAEVIDSAAFTGAMPDQHNLVRTHQLNRDLFVKACLFGKMFTLVMCFLSMHKVTFETKGIVRLDRLLGLQLRTVHGLKDVRSVVIDHDDQAMRLGWRANLRGSCLTQKLTETRDFFNA